MTQHRRANRITHLFFEIGVIGKGVDGILEIIGGVLLFFLHPSQIYDIVQILTQHELSEDPHDVLANYMLNRVQHLHVDTQVFGAIYLLWHGAVKVALVAALLLKKHWAYPAAIAAFLLFLAYQLYRYLHTHSPELLVLSVIDVFVIAMTYLEYRRLRGSNTSCP